MNFETTVKEKFDFLISLLLKNRSANFNQPGKKHSWVKGINF